MNEIFILAIFLALGFFAGILIGMLGIGGGIVFVPILHFLLPYTSIDKNMIVYIAIATSLLSGAIASVSSGIKHWLLKNLEGKKALLLGAGSLTSAFLAPRFVVNIDTEILKIVFAAVFGLIALKMLIENNGKEKKKNTQLNDNFLVLFGLMVGVIAAFVGIGGGILYVPILLFLFNVEIKKAIGTSSVVTAITMVAASISYAFIPLKGIPAQFQAGYVYLPAGLALGIASSFGAMIGISIIFKTNSKKIKRIFSILLIIVVLKIIFEI